MKNAIMNAITENNEQALVTLLTNADKGTKINLKSGTDQVLYEKTGKTWRYTRWDNGSLTYSAAGQRPLSVAKGCMVNGCEVRVRA